MLGILLKKLSCMEFSPGIQEAIYIYTKRMMVHYIYKLKKYRLSVIKVFYLPTDAQ